MVVCEPSILCNREQRIVECSVSRTGIHALIRSDHNRNFEIPGCFAERIHFFTGNDEAVTPEPCEDVFRGRVFPKCRAGRHIQPRRVARQPSFTERNEPSISLGRPLDKIQGLCEARSFVQVNGGGLRDSYTHSFGLRSSLSCFLCHDRRYPELRFTSSTQPRRNSQHALQRLRQVWEVKNAPGGGAGPL